MNQAKNSAALANSRASLTLAGIKAALETPLLILPPELQEPALRLWAMNRHIIGLESPLAIASCLSVWIADHGLRSDDAADILRWLTHPQRMASHNRSNDLMTALAAQALAAIERRRREAEQRRYAAEEVEPLSPERLRELREFIGLGAASSAQDAL